MLGISRESAVLFYVLLANEDSEPPEEDLGEPKKQGSFSRHVLLFHEC